MTRYVRMALGVGLLLTLCGLRSVADDAQEAAKKVSDQLQGTWKVVSVIADGEQLPKKELEGVQITFKRDKMTQRDPKGGREEWTYDVDPSKEPKIFNMTESREVFTTGKRGENTGKGKGKGRIVKEIWPGIYTLEGEKLTLCVNHASGTRPKGFESSPGSHVVLMVLERQKR
jgi:uncharacterized protein (TIGR03067 family)